MRALAGIGYPQNGLEWKQGRNIPAISFGASPSGPPMARPAAVYHFTTGKTWEKIVASGGLMPKRHGDPGTFALSWEQLTKEWATGTRHFGSPLQAFLVEMRSKAVNDEIVLLRIQVEPSDQLWARDLNPVFNGLDLGQWLRSQKPLSEFRPRPDTLGELIIANPAGQIPLSRVEVFRRIPVSVLPAELGRVRVDPVRLLSHVLNPDRGPVPIPTDAPPLHFWRDFLFGMLKNPMQTLQFMYHKAKS